MGRKSVRAVAGTTGCINGIASFRHWRMAIPLKPSLRVSPPRSNVPVVGWDWFEGCPSYRGYDIDILRNGVMRMLLGSCLLTVTLGLAPVVALGDAQSHRKAAENLLIVMEVDKSLPKVVEQVVETQMQQNPQLAPQREVLQRFLTKYVNWESVKEDTITAYIQEFTEPELKKLTEFYKTPLGKKASEKMPQLAFIAGQLGLRQAQAHQAELRQMLEDQKSKPGGGG